MPENAKTFGAYVRALRESKGIGQRELARQISISAPYLNDIEKDKRGAPRSSIVTAMAEALEASGHRLFDLAGGSRNEVAPDIIEMIQGSPAAAELLRAINDYNPTEDQIHQIRETIMAANTKAIIIAAGLGSRMKGHTEDKPKCMLEFGDKTLLQRQMEAYAENGVSDIHLIRGYKKEKITYEGITFHQNPDFESNNILNSLFYAEEAIDGHVIVSYSDILFEPHVVGRLLQSRHDISIVVDIEWREYYVGRKDHPMVEAENVIFDADNNVVEIGKILTGKEDVHGEFIGMMKFTPRGAEIFKRHFQRAKKLFWDKPFQRAQTFQKAYLTDMIQEMTDLGVPINCVIIERGWKEIDTTEDYEKALKSFEG